MKRTSPILVAAVALVGLVSACSGTSPMSGDSGLPDSGLSDSGTVMDAGPPADAGMLHDAGTSDAGTNDSGFDDGGILPGCSAAYHVIFDPVKAGQVPAGATVVGVTDPNEVLQIAAGSTATGDFYVFNQGSVVVGSGTAVTTLNGAVYLSEHASFRADQANLAVNQQYSGNFPIIAIDRATYSISNSQVSVGALPGIILPAILCGVAQLTATGTDFTVRGKGYLDPFGQDESTVTLAADQGNFEVTLDNAAHANIGTVSAPSVVGTYFTLHGTLGTLPILDSDVNVTTNLSFASGMGAAITSSNIFFGLWVEPGASFTIANSNPALFLTFRSGMATATGLHAGTLPDGMLPLSDRSITLSNTTIPILNVYETAPDTDAGQLTLSSSTVGEHNCHGPAGTRCLLQSGTIVDGSGGSLRAEDHAELDFVGSGYANAGVTTYATAVENSIIRLQNTSLTTGSSQPTVWIDAFDSSLVSLEDSVVGTGVPLRPHDDATIAQSWIAAPADGAAVSGSVIVGGIAQIATVAATDTNAFVSYTLGFNAVGTATPTVITTSTTAVTAFGALGTWNTTGLPSGMYQLHLTLTGKAGNVSVITHTVSL